MENIKILICCHKACDLPKDCTYLPIQVGAALSEQSLGMQRDDSNSNEICDNISKKNKNYCELTAIYWAWKNLSNIFPDIKFVGISHYRRFFYIPDKKLERFLKTGGVIIPKFKLYPYSVENAYRIEHESFDIDVLKTVIIELYPDYQDALLKVFRGNKTTVCNMFIASKTFFDSYCEWLFSILFEVEKRVHIDYYNDYQKRIFGFMSERLLYVYLLKNCIKVKETDIKTVDINEFSLLHQLFNNVRCNIAFFFGKKRHDSNV